MGARVKPSDISIAVQSARVAVRRAQDSVSAARANFHLTTTGRSKGLCDRYKSLSSEMTAVNQEIKDPINAPIKDFLNQRKYELDAQMRKVGKQLIKRARLTTITKTSDPRVLQQLVDNEAVHPVSTIDALKKQRLGDSLSNKTARALVVETSDGPFVLAGIFLKHASIPLNDDLQAKYEDIEGNVGILKDEAPKRKMPSSIDNRNVLDGVFFYTISSPIKGAGKALVGALTNEFEGNTLASTISPIRDFYSYLGQQIINSMEDDNPIKLDATNIENIGNERKLKKLRGNVAKNFLRQQSPQTVKAMVADYLSNRKDPVAAFHIGNGAYIGDIKVNLDNPIDPVTVNYVYPSTAVTREQNIENYKNGNIPVAGHLRDLMNNNHALHVVGGADKYVAPDVYRWKKKTEPALKAAA